MARPTGRPIQEEVIDAATRQIQQVGAKGFSYGDLANELGIKAPSIHHHFGTKEDLITAVAARYREQFGERVADLAGDRALDRISAYADLFTETASNDRLCLCGALSADWMAVGDLPRAEVHRFFDDQQHWLESELRRGVGEGTVRSDVEVQDLAATVLATLEGAVLMSRATSADTTSRVVTLLAALIAA